MSVRIYNTLTGRKEPFTPLIENQVKMYVCGPTVYDSSHIGHARSVVVFDMVSRYFSDRGFRVIYVRNFTDVDDKIIRRANELGIAPEQLAATYIDEFYKDMDALNVQRATHEPRATEYIDQMIGFIERLIETGLAYAVNGDVYYAVENFKPYGKLSGRRLEDMSAGARVDVDERKHNPFDFALWKSAKPQEPAWPSPWGPGRPGWHIECSAMSSHLLGTTFDIHGGGKDLIFPHHENEIAQSEGASGTTFARYWMHNGFVNIDHEKMSKSLGNFLLIKDVLDRHHPEAVRLFLLSKHYRSPIDYTAQNLVEAEAGLDKIYATLKRLNDTLAMVSDETTAPDTNPVYKRFCDAMDNDFNSAQGIGVLFDAVRAANRLLDAHDTPLTDNALQEAMAIKTDIERIGTVLGVPAINPTDYFTRKQAQAIAQQEINPDQIEALVAQRSQARKDKDWATADQIRNELQALGVAIEDTPGGTVWKIT
jgi:cysteinyl-tRNA synthetase